MSTKQMARLVNAAMRTSLQGYLGSGSDVEDGRQASSKKPRSLDNAAAASRTSSTQTNADCSCETAMLKIEFLESKLAFLYDTSSEVSLLAKQPDTADASAEVVTKSAAASQTQVADRCEVAVQSSPPKRIISSTVRFRKAFEGASLKPVVKDVLDTTVKLAEHHAQYGRDRDVEAPLHGFLVNVARAHGFAFPD